MFLEGLLNDEDDGVVLRLVLDVVGLVGGLVTDVKQDAEQWPHLPLPVT